MAMEAAPQPEAPTTELFSTAVGDSCSNCQAPMAADQRYCVECGERRAKPRFSRAAMALAAPAAATTVASASSPPPRPRFSSATTIVAGIATLLLAMGVGVLIGQGADKNTASKSPPFQVVTLGGSGTGAAANTTASSGSTSSARSAGAKHRGRIKPVIVHLTPKVQASAAAAARQVIGSAAPKNPTIQQGQSCTAGQSGCSGGRFTGSFFPGG